MKSKSQRRSPRLRPNRGVHNTPGDNSNDDRMRRLCRQVHQRLDLVFAGLEDPELAGLWVESVIPGDSGGCLQVQVIVDDTRRIEPVYQRLSAAQGMFRCEVAAAIHRKRAPKLSFVVLDEAAQEPSSFQPSRLSSTQ